MIHLFTNLPETVIKYLFFVISLTKFSLVRRYSFKTNVKCFQGTSLAAMKYQLTEHQYMSSCTLYTCCEILNKTEQ